MPFSSDPVLTRLIPPLLIVWGRGAWRLWRTPNAPLWARQQGLLFLAFLGGYLPNAMFHDLSIIPMVNMLLFFLAGVTESLRPSASARSANGLV
jgi:hypothetical protein